MEENQKPMTPLDRLVTPEQLQMMKAVIPFLPFSGQRLLAAYAKLTELNNTLQLFSGRRGQPLDGMEAVSWTQEGSCSGEMQAMAAAPAPSAAELLAALRPYAPRELQDSLDTLMQTVSMLHPCPQEGEEEASREVPHES